MEAKEPTFEVDERCRTILELLSWIDTGKAAKYHEMGETYRKIAEQAEAIRIVAEGMVAYYEK